MYVKKNLSWPYFEKSLWTLVLVAGLIVVWNAAPKYYPDSDGYLKMLLNRSCGYPLFIAFHKLLFGKYFLKAVMISQFLCDAFAAFFLIKCLQKTMHFNNWLSAIVLLVIIFPTVMGMKAATVILSESLAYALYLVVIGQGLMAIILKQNKHFYFAATFTFVAILVRGQFLFLVPALLIGILLAHYKNLWKKSNALVFITVLMIPVLTSLNDITFHKISHGQAVTTPWTGIQLASIPFFVSDQNDTAIFKTKDQKAYFNFVYGKLKEKQLLTSQIPPNVDEIDFFFDNYVEICNHTLHRDGINFFAGQSEPQQLILNDQMTSSMAMPLLRDNFSKWLRLYSANFMKGFDTSKYFLFYMILLLVSVVALIRKENVLSKFIIFLVLLMIGNVMLVALVESTIGRYTFYNNWIMIAIVLLLFQNNFYPKAHE